MIRKLLRWTAQRSHDLRVQTACATVYGLISIFGHGKTVVIIRKLIRMQKGKPHGKKV